MSWPESRRAFATREWANRNADIAGLWRSLMQWQNYTYDADLAITPGDAKLRHGDYAHPYQGGYDWGLNANAPVFDVADVAKGERHQYLLGHQRAPQRRACDAFTSRKCAQFYVPPSRILHAQKLRVWVYVTLTDATPTGRVDVTNDRTAVTTSVVVSSAALGGGGATAGWLSVDVAAQAHDSISVTVVRTAGTGKRIEVRDVSAYWTAPALDGYEYGTAFFALTRDHYATAYRPDSAYVARWLGLMSNRFMAHRSRLQVHAAHLAGWACGWMPNCYYLNGQYTQFNDTDFGRYRVLIGAGVSKLRFALLARSSDGAAGNYVSADVKVGGVSIGSTTNSPTNAWSWREFSIAIAPTNAVREAELVFTGTAAANKWTMLGAVSVWEEEATVTLVGAEVLPADFVANADEDVGGGRAITAAQRSRLVDNMLWLWKYRGLRNLVSDCRYSAQQAYVNESYLGVYGLTYAGAQASHYPLGNDRDQHLEYRFRFLGANRVPRFAIASHPAFPYAYAGDWDAGDYVWIDEGGQKAQLATRSRVEALGASPASPDAMRFTRTANFAQLSAGTVNVAGWGTVVYDSYPNSPDFQTELLAGLTIEEAPLHEAEGSRSA